MKTNMKRLCAWFLALTMLLSFTPTTTNAAKVKLNKTNVTLKVNQTVTLKLKNTKKKVKWSSSNKKVATVTKKGKVTAIRKGTAKITAKSGKKKYSCKVTVLDTSTTTQKDDNTNQNSSATTTTQKVTTTQKATTTEKVTTTQKATTTEKITTTQKATTTETPIVNPNGEGSTLNIYSYNEAFKNKFERYYPGYTDDEECTKAKDATGNTAWISGKLVNELGTFNVNWFLINTDENNYPDILNKAIDANQTTTADKKIDLFILESDYMYDYVNSDNTLDIKELGLSDEDTADMYTYTKDYATNQSDQTLRAVAWEANPGVFAYRRSIAKKVLGSDDPDIVQTAISTWDKFDQVAEKMYRNDYYMVSGVDATFMAFSNNTTTPWINENNEIIIDDNLWKWVEQGKKYNNNFYTYNTNMWSDQWYEQQGPTGKTFGFFYSTWGVNFTLLGNSIENFSQPYEKGNGIYGDWAICKGPASYFWGGSWFAAANGTDNKLLIGDIMRTLACNSETASKITTATQDYTNNQTAMKKIADSDYKFDFLDNQNPYPIFDEVARELKYTNITRYDSKLNDLFKDSLMPSIKGTLTKDEATEIFYNKAIKEFPELKKPNSN